MVERIKLITLILSTCICSLNMSAQKRWSLQECIERSIQKNISIKQSEIDLSIIKEDKKMAIGNFLPSLNLGGTHSWNIGLNQNITTGILENLTTQSGSVNANVGIDLFNGLQNIQQLYRANLSILASRYQLADMKEDISLLVANSYLQILFCKESLGVQESQLDIANEELIIAQEQLNSGVIPRGDVLEIEANVATMEQNVVVAKNNYTLSKIALAQLLLISDIENFEIEQKIDIIGESSILDTTVKTIYEAALSNRNDIKLAKTNLLIAKKDLAISKSVLLPSLSAFYSYNSRVLFDNPSSFSNQLDINAGQNFGLSLSIPILNNFSVKSNVNRSKVNILRNENQLLQKKLDLENTINQAHNDAKGALKAYAASKKSLESRELSYEYAREKFELGAMNSFDFTQVKQRFESAQSDLITSKFDLIFKIKVLEFYFGVPLSID